MDRGSIPIQKWLDKNRKREQKYLSANYHVIFLKTSLFLFWNNMDRKFTLFFKYRRPPGLMVPRSPGPGLAELNMDPWKPYRRILADIFKILA